MADDAITIEHQESGNKGRYVARIADSGQEAELTWHARGGHERGEGVRVADHTFTPPELRGRGIAGELVDALVADARQHDFRIVPQCPYVADKFAENPEWSDLKA